MHISTSEWVTLGIQILMVLASFFGAKHGTKGNGN